MSSYLQKGNEAFKKGDYQSAINLYQMAVKESPSLKSMVDFNIKASVAKNKKQKTEASKKLQSEPSFKQEKETFDTRQKIVSNKSNFKGYEGKLESFNDNLLKGWAVQKGKPAAIFDIDVYVNGIKFCSIKNNQSRGDLLRHKKSTGSGGFSLTLPSELFVEGLQKLEIKFPDGLQLAEVAVPQQPIVLNYQHVRVPVDENVSIIVPIYNAPDDLETCIERLIKYTRNDVDIILIDDASPDSRVQEILNKTSNHKNFRVFTNKKNLGFTKTVNRGIMLAGQNDVVFLNSDARVTPRWLEGLKAALATDAKIATVTPMSDRAGAFSAPNIGNENNLPESVKEEDYAVAFRRRSIGFYPAVPTGNGFCLYVRRVCINEIGSLDEEAFPRGYGEENDFCMRARAAGWRNVIDDRTYVFHDRNKSFGEAKTDLITAGRKIVDERYPDYKKSTAVFSQSPLINMARFRAGMALKDVKQKILPRGLFVISTLTGGTPQTNRDLMLALGDEIEPWLLHCDSKVISLYRVFKGQADQLIKRHILKETIEPLNHTSSEYDQVVANWLTELDFEIVHIRHLAWHSLNLPKLAKQVGARVIKSFHDYYAVCPTIKLLDNERKFCGGSCTTSCGECQPELWPKDSFPTLKNKWVHKWRAKFKEAVKECDAYITTHDSAKQIIQKHLDIDAEKFHVIPHGRDFKKLHQLAEPFKDDSVLKVLVPGNIGEPKGSKIIEELIKNDKDGRLEFHILGRASFKIKHPRLIVHGEYKRDDFAEHVKKIKPHIGAVLSIWNETWCHTLTELWSVGLPVVVTDFQTVAQRVEYSGAGWVLNSDRLNFELESMVLNQKSIEQKTYDALQCQKMLIDETTKLMASRYKEVYVD